jgi:nitrate reductase NapAB chaperone NapD
MKQTKILGILIQDRIKEAGRTQQVLSKHHNIIRSRLGFHELDEASCSRAGIITLVLHDMPIEWRALEEELKTIGGIEVQQMLFHY